MLTAKYIVIAYKGSKGFYTDDDVFAKKAKLMKNRVNGKRKYRTNKTIVKHLFYGPCTRI